jgi:signal transduction histidine kinase
MNPMLSQAYPTVTAVADQAAAVVVPGAVAHDVITYLGIVLIAGCLIYIAIRELTRSSRKAGTSEHATDRGRDSLEKRIAERTEDLIKAEEGRMRELQRIAQFGSLSQGLFHDLMGPLSSLALYVEKMAASQPEGSESKAMVEKAVDISKRMRSYMDAVKHSLGTEQAAEQSTADMARELEIGRDLLAYKARMADVALEISCRHGIQVKMHPVRIQQLFLNLISNGIDACSDSAYSRSAKREKSVRVRVTKNPNGISIEVSDTGCGIPADRLKTVFDHSFTTKPNGTGMGLQIVKDIIEKELHGTIRCESTEGVGTTFFIEIPAT